jgi:hypothetical protein
MPVLKLWTSNKYLSFDSVTVESDRLYYDTETKKMVIGIGNGQYETLSFGTGGGSGNGFTGSQGIIGFTGSRGYTGSQGITGAVVYDAGTPYTDFSVGININCGGVT